MFAAVVKRDRSMVEQTAKSHKASRKRKPALKAQKKRRDSKHPFRADDGAAASIAMEHQSVSVTRARRTSVVAIVKKRVEMLNMNVISREFPQVGDDDDTVRALVKKRKLTRETWSELCSMPGRDMELGTRTSMSSSQGTSSPPPGIEDEDGRDLDDTALPAGTRWMLHPHSQRKIKWDLLVAVLIVYSTLSVPFRIGFEHAAGTAESVVDGMVDVAFMLDIVASFRTAFLDENGETVVDTWEIGLRYAKDWFLIDLLSTVPVDKLAVLVARGGDREMLRSTKMLRILRLARLIKLVRLFKLGTKVVKGTEGNMEINPSLMSLIKMLMYMTYIAHILGCMWHWLATFEEDSINWVSYFGIADEGIMTHYVASVYWAFTTMTTVGYGDVVVTTTLERSFCVLGMVIGATVFGYIVGNVSVMMESFDLQSALRTQKMDRMKEYILSRRFPQKFSRRLLMQYKYHFKRVSVLDNYAILESLPTTARTNLLFAQYHDAVDHLKFLQNNPPIFVSRLVGVLTASFAKVGDLLFYQDEVGADMYFMVAGRVHLLITFDARCPAAAPLPPTGSASGSQTGVNYASFSRQTFLLAKLFKDSMVGEAGVMLDQQQPCAAVAMSTCDLFCVGKEDLLAVLDGWVDIQASLVNDARELMKRVENFKVQKGARETGSVGRGIQGYIGERRSSRLRGRRESGKAREELGGAPSISCESAQGFAAPSMTSVEVMQSGACGDDGAGTRGQGAIGSQPFRGVPASHVPRTNHDSVQPVAQSPAGSSRSPLRAGIASGVRSPAGRGSVGLAVGSKPGGSLGRAGTLGRAGVLGRNVKCGRTGTIARVGGEGGISPSSRKDDRRRRSVVSEQLMNVHEAGGSEKDPLPLTFQRRMTVARGRSRRTSTRVLPTEVSRLPSQGLVLDRCPSQTDSVTGERSGSDQESTSSAGQESVSEIGIASPRSGPVDPTAESKEGIGTEGAFWTETVEDRDVANGDGGSGFSGGREKLVATDVEPVAANVDVEADLGHDSGARNAHEESAGPGTLLTKGALASVVAGMIGGWTRVEEASQEQGTSLGAEAEHRSPDDSRWPRVGVRVQAYRGVLQAFKTLSRLNLPQAQGKDPKPEPSMPSTAESPAGKELQAVNRLDEEEGLPLPGSTYSAARKLKRKNMNFLDMKQEAKNRVLKGDETMRQISINELSPDMLWSFLYVIHPESMVKACWDVFVAIFIVFSVVEVTFRLGFNAPADGSWTTINYMVDVLFFFDMLMSFSTAYWEDGDIITLRGMITRNYLRGWFFVDFLSTIPLDHMLSKMLQNAGALRGTKLIRMVRLIRLFKIFRLLKMSTFFERYEDLMPVNPAVVRLAKVLILMSFAAHLGSCVWHAVGEHSVSKGRDSWIHNYCISDGEYSSCLKNKGLGDRYVAGVYWAFTTMTTVGYGDIVPASNILEMMVALVSEVAGTTLFAYVIGALVSIVLNLDPQDRLRKQQVEYLLEYMRDFNLTHTQKSEMKRHFNFKLSFNTVFPEAEILSVLPPYLRVPAVLYAYRASLPRLPLLCQIEMAYPGFLGMVLPRLRPGEYAKGEVVVSPHLGAQEMGFVLHGVCEAMLAESGRTIQTYREGEYMGHATLLVPDGVSFKVLMEVRAVMRLEMLILQKSDFDWLLTFYPDPMERLRDELTDWLQVLQWVSLPKVYTKRIQRILDKMGASKEEERTGRGAGDEGSTYNFDTISEQPGAALEQPRQPGQPEQPE